MTDSQKFIQFLIQLHHDLPFETLRGAAKDCIIDYLGCAYAGSRMMKDKLNPFIAMEGSVGTIPLIGMNQRTSPSAAALINAMNCHATELDDGHRFAMLHIEAPVISALISAAAGGMIADADAFLKGVIMGYEVTCRLAQVMQPEHKIKGFHATGTCAACGAALAIGFAAGYTQSELNHTLSAAVATAAGLLEMIDSPSQLKPFTVGTAARNGYIAACIGKAGFVGPDDPLCGKRGFFNAFGGNPELKHLFETEQSYKIEQRYTKPYASCRHCHPPIEAVLKIKEQNGLQPEAIEKIDIHTYELAIFGHDSWQVESVSAAKMSTPFSVAAALVTGGAGFDAYTEQTIHRQDICDLAMKVSISPSQEFNQAFPQKRGALVQITAKQQQVYTYKVEYPLGEPENPMKQEDIIKKYYELGSYAGKEKPLLDEVLFLTTNIENNFENWLNIIMK